MADVKISGRAGCGCVITTAATALRSPAAQKKVPAPPDRDKTIKVVLLPLLAASYAELMRVVASVVIEMCGHVAVDDFGFPPAQAGKVFPREALMQIYDVCAELLSRPMKPNKVSEQRREFYERAYAESAKSFIRMLERVQFPKPSEVKACALCRWYGDGADDPCRFHFAKAAPLASCKRFKMFDNE